MYFIIIFFLCVIYYILPLADVSSVISFPQVKQVCIGPKNNKQEYMFFFPLSLPSPLNSPGGDDRLTGCWRSVEQWPFSPWDWADSLYRSQTLLAPSCFLAGTLPMTCRCTSLLGDMTMGGVLRCRLTPFWSTPFCVPVG